VAPTNQGTLGWYSVHGHALAAAAVLGALILVTPREDDASPLAVRPALVVGGLMLVASQCFGTGSGVALAFPAVVLLLRPATLRAPASSGVIVGASGLVLVLWLVMNGLRTRLHPGGGESAMAMPGVARYFTRAQLERASISPGDPVARRILNGFYPQRSGDVIVVFEPYDILFDLPDDPADERSSATHGSPYSYDTHVPLIIMGRDFVKGSYPQEATPADIAPTLAGLLRVQAPSCSAGRVLFEALVNNKETRGFVR